MSSLNGGGYNLFDLNDWDLYLNGPTSVDIADGYNEFYDTQFYHVDGFVTIPNASFCNVIVNARNNTWTASMSNPPYPDANKFNLFYKYGPGNQDICAVNYQFDPVASVAACGANDPRDPETKSGEAKSGSPALPSITTAQYFNSTPLDIAIAESTYKLSFMDSLQSNDLEAAAMLHELLSANLGTIGNDSINALAMDLRWSALKTYKGAIEKMLADSTLSIDANQNSFQPEVLDYVQTLMSFTDSVHSSEEYARQFDLELMKAAVFHSIGKPELSYEIVDHLSQCEHDSTHSAILEKQKLAYANAVITMSQEFSWDQSTAVDTTVNDFSYASATPDSSSFGAFINDPNTVWYANCQDWQGYKRGSLSGEEKAAFILHPNPTSGIFHLNVYNFPTDKTTLEIMVYDMRGQAVYSGVLNDARSTINLSGVSSGVYLLAIINKGAFLHKERLVVTK